MFRVFGFFWILFCGVVLISDLYAQAPPLVKAWNAAQAIPPSRPTRSVTSPQLQVSGPTIFPGVPELDQLDDYLQASEAKAVQQFGPLRPGTEKGVLWANPQQPPQKTPWSIVYLHGFSASRGEISPVGEKLAKEWNANIFYTRLKGHGHKDGKALGKATAEDWIRDAEEALEIGKRLGHKVMVIGTSTGGTLATWLASKHGDSIHKVALISPNFEVKNPLFNVVKIPGTRPLLKRSMYDVIPHNPLHEKVWTIKHDRTALIPMWKVMSAVKKLDVSQIKAPVTLFVDMRDKVVKPEAALKVFEKWGTAHSASKSLHVVSGTQPGKFHVLVGDTFGPHNNQQFIDLLKPSPMEVSLRTVKE